MDARSRFDSARFVFEEAPRVDGPDKVRFIDVDEDSSEDETETEGESLRKFGDGVNDPSGWPLARYVVILLGCLLLLNISLLLLPDKDFTFHTPKKLSLRNLTLPSSTCSEPSIYSQESESTTSSSSPVPSSLSDPTLLSVLDTASVLSLLEDRVNSILAEALMKLDLQAAALIERELQVLSSQQAQRVLPRDFALLADGGTVYCKLTSFCSSWKSTSQQSAQMAIDEDTRIGQCWSLPSKAGQIGVLLQSLIYPSSITIDHIPRLQAADIGLAPRRMILWGVLDGVLNMERFQSLDLSNDPSLSGIAARKGPPQFSSQFTFAPLATFEYDINAAAPIQTFTISPRYQQASIDFALLVLEVLDNWGSASTCLYRVRIHGEEALDSREAGSLII